MCAGAIVQARIPKVVAGCMNQKAGCAGSIIDMFHVDKFNHKVEFSYGIMEDECRALMQDFFRKLRKK
jgi:tRNA(adenine34) deaminase